MARPEFNLTFRLITNGLRRSVCVDAGIYAEVSYRCVPLAARAHRIYVRPGKKSDEPMFVRGARVRLPGASGAAVGTGTCVGGEAEAKEEERRATQRAAVQPPADDVATAWETTFPWAGPAPTLVDLTGPDDDNEEDA
ncbi:hypothetical protein D1007_36405 [Hordeum vulgare]|nr:hypothetical protein D1007_36405 [Hordeum vulgare]